MKITKEWLEEKTICKDGIKWFCKQEETDSVKVIEKLISEEELDYAVWLISRLLSKKQCIQFSVYAAEKVLPIFEKEFPDDKRPRIAIEVVKKVIKNNSLKNRNAANAVNAVNAAAKAAAYAVAYANAANAYVTAYATYAAAYAAFKIDVIRYGISLLKEKEVIKKNI